MEKYNKNLLENKEKELADLIGFQTQVIEFIEDKLNKENFKKADELYLCGLKEEAINTSLLDFYEILSKLNDIENAKEFTICDIGASYAKMAFIANHFFPNIKVISIEPVKERINYAIDKLQNTKHVFINDIFKNEIIEKYKIDYFYLYFPVGEVLDDILNVISAPIIATESHGELLNRLGHSFTQKKKLTKLLFPRHNPHSYLFSNRGETSSYKAFKEFISRDHDLIIINEQRPWLADFDGLEHFFDEEEKITLELKCPPRTIYFNEDLETADTSNFSKAIQLLIQKRRANEKVDGYLIRKIFLDGSFELSSGEIKKAP